MLKKTAIILFCISTLGFVLSFISLVSTFLYFNLEKQIPMNSILFWGLIFVFFPTAFLQNNLRRNNENSIVSKNGYKYYPILTLHQLFQYTPLWMRVICVVLIAYTIIHVFIGNTSISSAYSGLMSFYFIFLTLNYSLIQRNTLQ